MADFKLFWPILLRQEGYYANDKDDSGGETWEGIARNKYPAWSGWGIIDSHRPAGGFVNAADANITLRPIPELQDKVIAFYKNSQWDVIQGDDIHNQSIADFLADWGVNAGLSVPIKHAQKVLGLDADGKVGLMTITAINSADGADLFEKLQQERKQFYLDVVAAKPQNKKFLSNWLERNASFKYSA